MADLGANVVSFSRKKTALLGGASYEAASRTSVELGVWHPSGLSPDSAILGDRYLVDARGRDMQRNSGWAYAAVSRKIDNVLGANVRLQVRPDYLALGITADQARDLAKQIESEWRLYALDPGKYVDAGRRLTFGGLARVLYWHHLVDGRCLAVPVYLPKRGGRYGTAFMAVDPMRLNNPNGRPDAWNLRGGIEIGKYGEPVAYNIQNRHPGDLTLLNPANAFTWTRIPAETSWGRARVIHWFDQRQAEQSSGMSALSVVLKKLRMLETRDDLELQRAAINATFAAFIKSALPSDTLFRALTEAPDSDDNADMAVLEQYVGFQTEFYDRNEYKLNGARVGHLLPGEEYQQQGGDGPGDGFEASERVWLRHVATALGLTYEQLSFDWSQVNYSSARAALNEVWKTIMAEREMFAEGVLTPMFALWLEEAIEVGKVTLPAGAPAFRDMPGAYCRLEWTGPGRGYIDPLKESNATAIRLETHQTTMQDELAEDGIDVEEHYEQLARERDLRRKYGLDEPAPRDMAAAAAMANAPEEPKPATKPEPAPVKGK